jgi:alkyl sulfatase BDS1-like metallo-beta-lactamase superfamily hydrolase
MYQVRNHDISNLTIVEGDTGRVACHLNLLASRRRRTSRFHTKRERDAG